MRFLVLFMMSVFTLVGMFAIALGVVYLIFNPQRNCGARGQGNDNDDDNDDDFNPKQNFGARGQNDDDDGKEERI